MIYLEEFAARNITIYYGTGSGRGTMRVRVAEFLENQTITKIRKLVKIIRDSYTPEEADVLAEYCTEWLKRYEPEQKALANRHVEERATVKRLEAMIQANVGIRDRYRKKSEPYEHYNELVKKDRESLKFHKSNESSSLRDFKANERNKEKFSQVLEFINGQR